MQRKISTAWFLLIALLAGFLFPAAVAARADQPQNKPALASQATPFDLIIAMNTLRVSNGLPALVEDPIIDAVAQATAATMAADMMSWHIGNVSGRLAAAGYGGGAKVWATENFVEGFNSIDQIMQVWSDPSHMIPAVVPAYCNIGAGAAKAPNGTMYYVLQAAYTSAKACGDYKPSGATVVPGISGSGISQVIVPVKIATPDADGKVYHVVQQGQSLWAIAITYKITIKDLQEWNNLPAGVSLQIGQRLFIPGSNTAGYFTPTPPGMVQVSTPGPDGKIVHIVQVYQALSTISQAYGVDIQTVLTLNGLQADWPLQIGQKLVIRPSQITPSPTPRPLTPLEKLTPEADGKYYHIVKSGENLSWIAKLYDVKLTDLMSWNGLDGTSVLRLNQKLLLQVTPPATRTYTPGPPTATLAAATATLLPSSTATATLVPTRPTGSPSAIAVPPAPDESSTGIWLGLIGLVAAGGFLVVFFSRRRQ